MSTFLAFSCTRSTDKLNEFRHQRQLVIVRKAMIFFNGGKPSLKTSLPAKRPAKLDVLRHCHRPESGGTIVIYSHKFRGLDVVAFERSPRQFNLFFRAPSSALCCCAFCFDEFTELEGVSCCLVDMFEPICTQ